jgi:hypothetical protein
MAPKYRQETQERTLRDGSKVRWTEKVWIDAQGKEWSRSIDGIIRHDSSAIGEPDLDRLLKENGLTR